MSTIRISLSIDCLYLTLRIGLQSPPGSRVNGPARSHNTQSTPFSSSAVAVLDEASLFELTWHLCHHIDGNGHWEYIFFSLLHQSSDATALGPHNDCDLGLWADEGKTCHCLGDTSNLFWIVDNNHHIPTIGITDIGFN